MPHIFEPKVADLNAVPEPFRAMYQPTEGGYAMPAEVFEHLDTTGLRSGLDKERKRASEAEKSIKSWKALGAETPEDIQAKLQALQDDLAKKGGHEGQLEKLKAELQSNHSKELQAREEQLTGMRRTLESYLVDSEAQRALAEAKGSAALLLPIIKNTAKVVEVDGKYVVRILDAEGDPRYNSKGDLMTVNDLVQEFKLHKEYGKAFEPSGTSGGGTRPGTTGRTTPVNTGNLTPTQKIAAGLSKLR